MTLNGAPSRGVLIWPTVNKWPIRRRLRAGATSLITLRLSIPVLPETKTNIIGFRNRYALGEQVELLCSSDFSRPKPALGWFINGQRVS